MNERFTIAAPKEQVETWREEAGDEQGDKSEYGRQMMEAGRREMGLVDTYTQSTDNDTEPKQTGEIPDLKHRVVQQLDEEDSQDINQIVEGITQQLENEVEQKINELMGENQIQFQDGGFIKS